MLELAASTIVTASSAFLFGYWCHAAYRFLFRPAGKQTKRSDARGLTVSLGER
jgi:hypothetical protein